MSHGIGVGEEGRGQSDYVKPYMTWEDVWVLFELLSEVTEGFKRDE